MPTQSKSAAPALQILAAGCIALVLGGCETVQRIAPGGLLTPDTVPDTPPNPEMTKRIETFLETADRGFRFPSLADMPSEGPKAPSDRELNAARSDLEAEGAALKSAVAADADQAAADRAAFEDE